MWFREITEWPLWVPRNDQFSTMSLQKGTLLHLFGVYLSAKLHHRAKRPATSVIMGNLSGFNRDAALVRCRLADVETGCNFKQRAFTLNGRTPATKAATTRLPLTALPFFSATCVTPGAILEKYNSGTAAECTPAPREGFGNRPLPNEHWQAHIDEMVWASVCKSWWNIPFREEFEERIF